MFPVSAMDMAPANVKGQQITKETFKGLWVKIQKRTAHYSTSEKL